MNCLHIFDGMPILESIFTQQCITHLCNKLQFLLVQENDAQCYHICNIFPQLKVLFKNYAKIDDDHSSSYSSSSSSSTEDNEQVTQTEVATKLPPCTNIEKNYESFSCYSASLHLDQGKESMDMEPHPIAKMQPRFGITNTTSSSSTKALPVTRTVSSSNMKAPPVQQTTLSSST